MGWRQICYQNFSDKLTQIVHIKHLLDAVGLLLIGAVLYISFGGLLGSYQFHSRLTHTYHCSNCDISTVKFGSPKTNPDCPWCPRFQGGPGGSRVWGGLGVSFSQKPRGTSPSGIQEGLRYLCLLYEVAQVDHAHLHQVVLHHTLQMKYSLRFLTRNTSLQWSSTFRVTMGPSLAKPSKPPSPPR